MKNKILLILIFLLVLLLSPKVYAQDFCSENGYTLLTINGMFTEKEEAINNMNKLKNLLPTTYKSEPLNVNYLYNGTHVAGALDIVDVIVQGLFDSVDDYDLIEMLDEASQKINTQKVLLLGYSQGNFYANDIYDKLADQKNGIPSDSFSVYGVATPDDHVSGDGKYITSDTDTIIATLVNSVKKIMKPNTHIDLENEDGNGHSFSNVYLKYKSDKIISDIKYSLSKLKNNTTQNENESCIATEEDSEIHNLLDAILPLVDYIAENEVDTFIEIYKKIKNIITSLTDDLLDIALDNLATVGLIEDNSSKDQAIEEIDSLINFKTDNSIDSTQESSETSSNNTIRQTDETNQNSDTETSSIIEINNTEDAESSDNQEEDNDNSSSKSTHHSSRSSSSSNNDDDEEESVDESQSIDDSSDTEQESSDGGQEEEISEEDGASKEEENSSEETENDSNNEEDAEGEVEEQEENNYDDLEITGSINNEDFNSSFSVAEGGVIIELNGSSFVTVKLGDTYEELGVTARDSSNGKGVDFYTFGTVDTSEAGLYFVKYMASDGITTSTKVRLVNIVDPSTFDENDKTSPNIYLKGDEMVYVSRDIGYTEQGVYVSDDMTNSEDLPVVISNTLDSSAYYNNKIQIAIYATTDKSGNTAIVIRHVEFFDHAYDSRYTFGTENGDGRDWQVWIFNGSLAFDWKDSYVNGYLKEEFKIESSSKAPLSCSGCLLRGIFNRNPLIGFNSNDFVTSGLENNPQNVHSGKIYDVSIQWDANGYLTTIFCDGEIVYEERVDIKDMDENTWVGWSTMNNRFVKFPSGYWHGNASAIYSTQLEGGTDMLVTPYPIYDPDALNNIITEEEDDNSENNNEGEEVEEEEGENSDNEEDQNENSEEENDIEDSNTITVNNFNEMAFPFEEDDSVITLDGSSVIVLEVGDSYVEPGATCYDSVGGKCTLYIDNSSVDTSKPGLYMIRYYRTYNGSSSNRIRLVNIIDNSLSIDGNDKTSPVITLNGESEMKITIADGYQEEGAIALDDEDGEVSVIISDTLTIKSKQDQAILYAAVDKAGNIGFAIRHVKFYDHIYIPKYTFGTENGDGRDWEAWFFDGSTIYDWENGYVDGYLHQEFKVKSENNGLSCGDDCLLFYLFDIDPQEGYYNTNKQGGSTLQPDIQNKNNGLVYQVVNQWNQTSLTTYQYFIDASGNFTYNIMRYDRNDIPDGLWIGWGTYNNGDYFNTYPTNAEWIGINEDSSTGLQGGKNIIVRAYPVYDPEGEIFQNVFDPENNNLAEEQANSSVETEELTELEDTDLALISYSLNGQNNDIDINPIENNLTINLEANRNVNWLTIKIESEDDTSYYKILQSNSTTCVDGTSTCSRVWDGLLSSGGLLKNGVYKIRVHMQDEEENDYEEYLPIVINVIGQEYDVETVETLSVLSVESFMLGESESEIIETENEDVFQEEIDVIETESEIVSEENTELTSSSEESSSEILEEENQVLDEVPLE